MEALTVVLLQISNFDFEKTKTTPNKMRNSVKNFLVCILHFTASDRVCDASLVWFPFNTESTTSTRSPQGQQADEVF